MTTIADDVFAEIEAHEAERGFADVCDICNKRNPEIHKDRDRERTTYTFDDGSHIVDEGDMGSWVVDGRIAFSPLLEQEDGQ